MRVVTEPLRSNDQADIYAWEQGVRNAFYDRAQRFTLALDDDERTALLYKFFLFIKENEFNLPGFCHSVFGSADDQEANSDFNNELVEKFTREVKYRLDEILESVASQETVASESLIVFEHHDHSTNLHGDFRGSNIAIGGSTVSGSSATYTNREELANALKALKPLIREVLEPQREAVAKALDLLIQGTEDSSITEKQVVDAATTISANAPSLGARMKDIASGVTAELAKLAIVQWIKYATGIE
jgi:hypothetical protein